MPVCDSFRAPAWYTRISYLAALGALLHVNRGLADWMAPEGVLALGRPGLASARPAAWPGRGHGGGAERREQQRQQEPPEQHPESR